MINFLISLGLRVNKITYWAGATGTVGQVLTGPLLASSYTICIRVSYSTGPLHTDGTSPAWLKF